MTYEDNIKEIKEKGYHYIVATRQKERDKYLDDFEEEGFHELIRSVSPTNLFKKKSGVFIKKKGSELYILCISEGRGEKDKVIRESHEKKLAKRINKERLKKEEKIYEAIKE